jgi:hypothetical protein
MSVATRSVGVLESRDRRFDAAERRPGRVGALSLVGLLATAAVASADLSFTVNSTLDRVDVEPGDGECVDDQGKCSLRAAVMEASAATGSVTVTVNLPAGHYLITRSAAIADGGDLNLTTPTIGSPTIVVSGSGPATTVVDANLIDRAFAVGSGRTARISGVSIVNGSTEGPGGGIASGGVLTVSYCEIVDNESGDAGGGIFNLGELTLIRSTLRGNRAEGGGGIANLGEMTVDQSTISGNQASGDGGGVFNLFFEAPGPEGETRISRRDDLEGSAGTLYVVNSTISGNHADGDGGGIVDNGTTWTYNVTIAFNNADAEDDDVGLGGGIYQHGVVHLRNTLVAGNYVDTAYSDCFGTVGVFGRSLFWTEANCNAVEQNAAASVGEVVSLAEIGPLRSNGGWTETHALLAPSTIIDGGTDPPGCTYGGNLLVDQRGGTRGLGTLCDIGAFEEGGLPAGSIFSDDFEAGNLYAW